MRTCILCVVLATGTPAGAAPVGYTPKVSVSAPTRLDWMFTASNQSPLDPPKELKLDGYDSTKQNYELYIPEGKDAKPPYPAVLFISASNESQGWKAFEAPCKKLGMVFVGVRGAGNNVDFPKRCRIILDCLDDVRRQAALDPDRTYITGFSGGGRMSCAIGFALPEVFGGVMPLCAGGQLREESWLRHRAIDRLSVALITGTNDFNRGEVEQYRGPLWKEIGIRAKVWVQPNLGHSVPSSDTILDALKFLEEGKGQRAALAKKHPATRITPEGSSRQAAAKALLAEGEEKLKAKETTFAGLMLLNGVQRRWPDLDEAGRALDILKKYEGMKDKPWEKDDLAEQRKFLIAEARHLSDYALLGIPPKSPYEKYRPDMAKKAIELWGRVIGDAPDSDAAKEGKKRLADLEKLAAAK